MHTRILQDACEIQLLAIVCRLITERTMSDILSFDQSREAGRSLQKEKHLFELSRQSPMIQLDHCLSEENLSIALINSRLVNRRRS